MPVPTSPSFGLFARFFGRTVSEGAAFAMGAATAPVLEPPLESLRQAAWDANATRALEVVALAEGLARGKIDPDYAHAEARLSGFAEWRLDRLVRILEEGPGTSRALELWRRGLIDEAGFRAALKHDGLEDRWIEVMGELHDVLLSPAELANARQQGHIDAARQLRESALQGVTEDRAEILFQNVGLPPGPETMQRAANRGLTDRATFGTAIREGHTKTKYTELLWEMRAAVLSATQYVNAAIRGWITTDAMYAGAAKTGISREDADLLFKIHGRPISFRQVFIGRRRGGTYDGPTGGIDPAFLSSLRQSDIRPEWYNLAWSQRYTYPSAFVLRGMAQAGDLTAAEVEQVLLYVGWEPTFAAKVAGRWAQGASGTGGKTETVTQLRAEYESGFLPETQFRQALEQLGYTAQAVQTLVHLGDYARVKKVRDQLVANARKGYVNRGLDEGRARELLTQAGMHATAQDAEIAGWNAERDSLTAELTDAQVVKAYKKGLLTEAEALDELVSRGLPDADARIRLQL